jgi:hypothetical protein
MRDVAAEVIQAKLVGSGRSSPSKLYQMPALVSLIAWESEENHTKGDDHTEELNVLRSGSMDMQIPIRLIPPRIE